MPRIPNEISEVDEAYLTKRYSVSRQQARRMIRRYGCDKSDIDFLLGARGRTRQHRRQDLKRSMVQVSFG